jgi:hypothetical protein
MASLIKIKRSAVAGKIPSTSHIETGELAINLADGRLFSSNGSVIFEIGANVHSLSVGAGGLTVGNGAFTLPTSDGTSGQFLSTDGSGNLSWQNTTESSSFEQFTFYSSNNQTVFSGADNFGNPLEYSPEKITVYLNGIKLVANTDYVAANGSAIILQDDAREDDVLEVQSFPAINIVNVDANLTSNTKINYNLASNTEVIVDSWGSSAYRSAKYMVQIENTDNVNQVQVSEVLLIHNGSATFITEYGTVKTSTDVGTIDSDINSGIVRLKVTPNYTNSKIKVTRLSISI